MFQYEASTVNIYYALVQGPFGPVAPEFDVKFPIHPLIRGVHD
jgi:hypothetical protein